MSFTELNSVEHYIIDKLSGVNLNQGHLVKTPLQPYGAKWQFQSSEQLEFLFYFIKSLKFESFKRKVIKVGTQPNINSVEYQSMYLPNLLVSEQDKLVEGLDNYVEIIYEAQMKIGKSRGLQSSLINQVF